MSADQTPSRGVSATRLAVVAVVVIGALPLAAAGAPSLLPGAQEQVQQQQQQPQSSLDVDPSRADRTVRPGNSTTIEVTLTNDGDEAVSLNTSVVALQQAPDTVPTDWVTIDAPDEVPAGESVEATVTIAVPADAESARRYAGIAFTGVTSPRAGPVGYVDSMLLSLEVERPPTVFVRSGDYLRDEVRAGESSTQTVVVENTGDEAVPVDPSVVTDRGYCSGPGCPTGLPAKWVSVDAPEEIAAGETAEIDFTVSVPEGAESGRYDVEYTLGIDDPARPDEDEYWQRVDLSVGVWQVPEDPITETFEVDTEDDTATITLSASGPDGERPAFEVEIEEPDGDDEELEPVRVRKNGNVDLVDRGREDQRRYGPRYEFVYVVDLNKDGEYTLSVMPENTPQFGWEIVTEDEDR